MEGRLRCTGVLPASRSIRHRRRVAARPLTRYWKWLTESLRELRRPLIIPAEVLAETLNVLRPRLGNEATATIGNELLTSADIAVITPPREVLELTLTKLRAQTGNASYIDCLVMVTVDQYRTRSVFGFDETFPEE